jgi:hypothetical protein
VTGYSEELYSNIGSFDFLRDLLGAAQLTYGNRSINAQPLWTAADLHCGAARLTPLLGPPQNPAPPIAYGSHVYALSVEPRWSIVLTGQHACLAAGGIATAA